MAVRVAGEVVSCHSCSGGPDFGFCGEGTTKGIVCETGRADKHLGSGWVIGSSLSRKCQTDSKVTPTGWASIVGRVGACHRTGVRCLVKRERVKVDP